MPERLFQSGGCRAQRRDSLVDLTLLGRRDSDALRDLAEFGGRGAGPGRADRALVSGERGRIACLDIAERRAGGAQSRDLALRLLATVRRTGDGERGGIPLRPLPRGPLVEVSAKRRPQPRRRDAHQTSHVGLLDAQPGGEVRLLGASRGGGGLRGVELGPETAVRGTGFRGVAEVGLGVRTHAASLPRPPVSADVRSSPSADAGLRSPAEPRGVA